MENKVYEVEVYLDKNNVVSFGTTEQIEDIEKYVFDWNNIMAPDMEQDEIERTGVQGNVYIPRTFYPYLIDADDDLNVVSYDNGGYTYEQSWVILTKAYSTNRAIRNAYSFACAQI